MAWFVQSSDSAAMEGPFSGEVEAQRRARKLTKRRGSTCKAVNTTVDHLRDDSVPKCGAFRGPKGPAIVVESGSVVSIESANGDQSGAIIMPKEVADRLRSER